MDGVTKDAAEGILKPMLGQPLHYSRVHIEYDMFEFGFGPLFRQLGPNGMYRMVCPYTIHTQVPYLTIKDRKRRRAKDYYWDTTPEVFYRGTKKLIGLEVKRVGLSEKNDLWIDLGDYWIVFPTYENGEESWRFFTPGSDRPHLVASDSWVSLEY